MLILDYPDLNQPMLFEELIQKTGLKRRKNCPAFINF